MSSSPLEIPEAVARIAALMSTFRPRWSLCGGWAADAWLGRQTRDHADIDITVFADDQGALFDHLAGWQLIGHDNQVADDSSEPWDGRPLTLPAHIHARPPSRVDATPGLLDAPSKQGFHLEVILNERSGNDWVISAEPAISLPLQDCVQQSAWGLPAVSPAVILFYKAHPPVWRETPRAALRPHDERDFRALLPVLSARQRDWLGKAIALVQPGHQWLGELAR